MRMASFRRIITDINHNQYHKNVVLLGVIISTIGFLMAIIGYSGINHLFCSSCHIIGPMLFILGFFLVFYIVRLRQTRIHSNMSAASTHSTYINSTGGVIAAMPPNTFMRNEPVYVIPARSNIIAGNDIHSRGFEPSLGHRTHYQDLLPPYYTYNMQNIPVGPPPPYSPPSFERTTNAAQS